MNSILIALLILLVICAVCVSFTKKVLPALIIFMFYSLIMAAVWLVFESPDLAITEAAVGAGITSVLFFAALRRIGILEEEVQEEEEEEDEVLNEEN